MKRGVPNALGAYLYLYPGQMLPSVSPSVCLSLLRVGGCSRLLHPSPLQDPIFVGHPHCYPVSV